MLKKNAVFESQNFSYIRFMRIGFALLLVIFPLWSAAQKKVELKKKYFGRYEGEIPAYKMDVGAEVVAVSPASIGIRIEEDSVFLTIGQRSLKGSYDVLFLAKTYYLLDAKMEGQLASERILVYKRGKKLSRDGLYPQPVSELRKVK